MNLDNHEHDIRNKMLQHRDVINPDEVWQELEPKLHPKKKRRFLLFWFFGIVGLAFTAWVWTLNSESSDQHTSLDTQAEAIVQDLNTPTQSAEALGSETTPINQQKRSIDKNTSTDLDESKAHTTSTKKSATSINSNSSTNNKSTTQPSTFSSSPTSSKQSNKHINSVVKNELSNEQTNPVVPAKGERSSSDEETEQLNIEKNREKLEQQFNTENKTDEIISQTQSLNIPIASKAMVEIPAKLTVLDLQKLDYNFGLEPGLSKSTLLNPVQRNNQFFVSLSSGWGLFDASYEDAGTENTDYVHYLSETNEGISSQHLGLGFRYYRNNWYIQSGIDYSRLVNRTSLFNVVKVDTLVQGIQEVYYMKSGEIQRTEGQVPSVIYRTQDIQWHTYRHVFDIPILLGYEKTLGRVSLGGSLGVAFRVHQQASGAYLNEHGRLIKFEKNSDANPFNKSINMSYRGGLKAGYKITRDFGVEFKAEHRIHQSENIQFDQLITENKSATIFSVSVNHRFR